MKETDINKWATLMIEKIKQVEDNWQKPWFGIKGGGLPQNIEGRTYNGVNSFMLFLLSEKEQYSLPVYMTFMYNPQIEMFARFKMKSSFHKTKRII